MLKNSLLLVFLFFHSSAILLCAEIQSTYKPRIAIFYERNFRSVDGIFADRPLLERALDDLNVEFLNADSLQRRLVASSYDALVLPYGSTFPKQAWSTLVKFLADGGSWVNLGGIPFSIPANRDSTGWREEVRQTQYHKRLGITQSLPVSTKSIVKYFAHDAVDGSSALIGEFQAEEIHELYYRFTETIDYPQESGSAGSRDAMLHPLVYGLSAQKQRLAVPFLAIDRMQGEYAGGRWVLANFRGTMSAKAIRTLVNIALRGPAELCIRPSFASYRESELPSFTVRLRCPKGNVKAFAQGECVVEIQDDQARTIEKLRLKLQGDGTVATGMISSRTVRFGRDFIQLVQR